MGERTGRIVVVDDDPLNRRLLSRTLENAGHHVRAACDGRGASERCRALEETSKTGGLSDGGAVASAIEAEYERVRKDLPAIWRVAR
jgi:Response regulator receiver domain.